jgi:hypothetical protein
MHRARGASFAFPDQELEPSLTLSDLGDKGKAD